MTCLVPDMVEKIFESFALTSMEAIDIKVIHERFTQHFSPRSNKTYEQYLFNKIAQKPGQKFDDYLIGVKLATKNCNFEDLKDSLIRDKIVMGICSDKVREKLLSEVDLTMHKARYLQGMRANGKPNE
jgi:hypothetical protein